LTASAKQRVVHAALVAVVLWPCVQLALVARWDVSPWKLAGWGMYATPRFPTLGMEIWGRDADGTETQLTTPTPPEAAAATAYLESYRWLRALASQDDLTRAVFAARPAWTRLRIVVFRPDMRADTGMVEMRAAEYVVAR
jgi:hypothetical protein